MFNWFSQHRIAYRGWLVFASLGWCASFSALATNSLQPNADGTVLDTATGLVWKRCMEGQTWDGSTCTGIARTASPNDSAAYCNPLSSVPTEVVSFAGKSDWRLPNIRELMSIVDYSTTKPAIDKSAFPNAWSSETVSSTSDNFISGAQLNVDFETGLYGTFGVCGARGVRLVRSDQASSQMDLGRPSSDYVDGGDGTVTHSPTGLMWQRCEVGQTWTGSTCVGSANSYSWQQAKSVLSDFAGKADWRLPTIPELAGLVDHTNKVLRSPFLNAAVFPNATQSGTWSGTPNLSTPPSGNITWSPNSDGWGLNFGGGVSVLSLSNASVRLVRTAQSKSTPTVSDVDCFLNWAEVQLPTLLQPPLQSTQTILTINYRAYNAGVFLGVDGSSGAVLALGGALGNSVLNLGQFSNFLSTARGASCGAKPALISQTIAFGAIPVIAAGSSGTITATGGGSGNSVTFASETPAICTVGTSGFISGVSAGACTITANQSGNANYSAAPQVSMSFAIAAAPLKPQAITFGSSPSIAVGNTGTVNATGGESGNPVTFTSNTPSICTVNVSGLTTGIAAGICSITANQAGNGTYSAATKVTISFVVSVSATPYSTVENYSITECVKDTKTGLIWEGKTASGLRAGTNTYSNLDDTTKAQVWGGLSGTVPRLPTETEVNAANNSVGYVKAVNAAGLCGFTSGWRMPTATELMSLMKQGVGAPTIDTAWFPNTPASRVWAGPPSVDPAYYAWHVYFLTGGSYNDGYRQHALGVRLVRSASTPPSPVASLDWLQFTDANNWYYRVFVATAAESTPDANGIIKYREIRAQNTSGTTVNWAFNSDYNRRDDLHFNGQAWVSCPLGTQNTQTKRDAQGKSESRYCDNYNRSTSDRTDEDVSGKTLSSVVSSIRSYPYSYGGATGYSQWGLSSLDSSDKLSLGNAVFPTGSVLSYQTITTTETSVGYDIRSSNEIFTYSAAVASGGDARTSATQVCNSAEAQVAPTIRVTTFEQMTQAFRGTPCVFAQGTLSVNGVTYKGDEPNEWWGNSTLSIGIFGTASITSATAYYTTNSLIRVGFTGPNAVAYYSCKQRALNGTPRNCKTIGTGTYSIESLGDARVLKLSNAPSEAAPFTYDRVFVERSGKVYLGYQDKLGSRQNVRLNLEATNALFQQIGIPKVSP